MATSTLLSIVSQCSQTELGKKWNFSSISTIEEYRRNVPLTDYDTFRPYIERMVTNGETDLIAPGNVTRYVPTSGTTSQSKLFPRFPAQAPKDDLFPRDKTILLFLCRHKDKFTPMGIPIVPGATKDFLALVEAHPYSFVPPMEAYEIEDLMTSLYVQLVTGIKHPSADSLWTGFNHTFLTAFKLLAAEWEQMVDDIRNGTLKQSLDIDDSHRKALEKCLGGPDPVRAEELSNIFHQASSLQFESIASKLWPKLTSACGISGGSFAAYVPHVQHYLGSGVHLFSLVYVASEGPGMFGINKCPQKHSSAYSLQTNDTFFEFIPFDSIGKQDPEVLLADEVKPGEVYEIVITTSHGLYRYRIGDLIKVLEVFPDSTEPPVIDVLGRSKMNISVYGERMQDFHVTEAISSLCSSGLWKKYKLVDFTVSIDFSQVLPRYQFWVETSPLLSAADLSEGVELIDSKLREVNASYARYRNRNMIDSLTVSLVKLGAFELVMKLLKDRSPVPAVQLKMLRITKDQEILALLEANKE